MIKAQDEGGNTMQRNGNIFTFVIALLGAIKLVADSFGYKFINDDQINAIANLAAILATVAGIALNHFKAPQKPQEKITNINTYEPKD